MFRRSLSTSVIRTETSTQQNNVGFVKTQAESKENVSANAGTAKTDNQRPIWNSIGKRTINKMPSSTSSNKSAGSISSGGLQRSGSLRVNKSQSDVSKPKSTPIHIGPKFLLNKKASTPIINNKTSDLRPLDFSGGSAILSPHRKAAIATNGMARSINTLSANPRINVRRNLGGDFSNNQNPNTNNNSSNPIASKGPLKLKPIAPDSYTNSRAKETELAVLRSECLRAVFLDVSGQLALKRIELDGQQQITDLWRAGEQLRDKDLRMKAEIVELQEMTIMVERMNLYERLLLQRGESQAMAAGALERLATEIKDRNARIKLVGVACKGKDQLEGTHIHSKGDKSMKCCRMFYRGRKKEKKKIHFWTQKNALSRSLSFPLSLLSLPFSFLPAR